ncbi:RNA polymerase sigma factor [Micromonospora sp. NPDC049230]|uniref:RNA polymerase sigma factor n=1 Tax=Micromonospora sp. NPDC049230 TaxID=3155502 RepID=UPI0033F6C87D
MPPSLNRARFTAHPTTQPTTPVSDDELWDLVDQARAGDSHAFTRFFDATVSAVFGYINRRLPGDRDLAEQITAEVYLGAWSGLRTLRRVASSPIAWLRTIAQRRVVDHHRSRKRHVLTLVGTPADLDTYRTAFSITGAPLDAPAAETRYEERSEARRVWSYAEQLTDDQHRVLRCRFWLGWSLEDTAAALGKPVAAVKSLQYRAIQSLRKQLTGSDLDPNAYAVLAAA